MYHLPTRTLQALIHEHSRSLCDDPARCEDLMRTACPLHRREVTVLMEVLQLGLVNEMLQSEPNQDWRLFSEPLIRRLTTGGKFDETEARPAVEAWTQILEIPVHHAPFVPLEAADLIQQRHAAQERVNELRGAVFGGLGGALAGATVAFFYCHFWAAAVHAGRPGQPAKMDDSWMLAVPVGALIGGLIGFHGGRALGNTQAQLARALSGTVVGAMFGAYYHPLWAWLFASKDSPVGQVVAQVIMGALVGLVGGGLLSLILVEGARVLDRGRGETLDDVINDLKSGTPG